MEREDSLIAAIRLLKERGITLIEGYAASLDMDYEAELVKGILDDGKIDTFIRVELREILNASN